MLIDVIPEHWFHAGYEWTVLELLRSIDVAPAERVAVYEEWSGRAGVVVTAEALKALGLALPVEVV